jgi:UDP-N-acetylglucosamine acyltransferase
MAYSHVAHDCQVGNKTIFANAASLAGHVHVGDQAILGGFTSVHQFSQIGAHSFSGLGTVINRDVPPFVIVAGNHAQAYGLNKNGLKRRGFSPEVIAALHKVFKLVIKGHKKREDIMSELEPLLKEYAEVRQMIEFIDASERGIVR